MMRDRAVWVVWAALLLAGCGGDRPDPVGLVPVVDLLAELPAAEIRRESERLDFSRDRGRWSEGERFSGFAPAGAGEDFRWGTGESSHLTFFVAERRRLSLTFRAFPFRFPDAPQQEVEIVLNGRGVDRVEIDPGTRDYHVGLPRSAVRAGDNRMELRYAYAAVPSRVSRNGSDDSRSLAAAFVSMELDLGVEDLRGRDEVTTDDDGISGGVRFTRDELYLPYGSRVSYYLMLPPRAALAVDGLVARGGGGRLDVRVQIEDEDEVCAGELTPAEGSGAVRLAERGGLARISLTALPDERPVRLAQGLVLRRPVVALSKEGGDVRSGPTPSIAVAAAAEPGAAETAEVGGRRPNVLVYLVDTLRADHLGAYGYERPVSPRLDAFAAGATLFETAVAQSPWTRPSVVSLFTGLTPHVHGVNGTTDGLASEAVTMAEVLSAHGYRTAAMIANPAISQRFRLGQGFDSYELLEGFDNGAPEITAWAARWLREERSSEEPFFLYLHTIEPHAPYSPTEEHRARFAPDAPRGAFGTRPHIKHLKEVGEESLTKEVVGWLRDLYDAEIAANDAAFGELLDVLDKQGLVDETVIVFVSDHGEEFMEHGQLEHAKTFYREVIEVPLVIRFPDLGQGRRIAAPVQHIDVLPTLLSYLGLAGPPGIEGRDLTPWVAGEEPSPEAVEAAEIHSYLDRRGYRGGSVLTGRWRYVDMLSPHTSEELFDLQRDRAEAVDRSERDPVRTGWMRSRMRGNRRQAGSGNLSPTEETMDKELREQLRALGYL
jgi:arylsulfatase A-like enzyme